MRFVSWLLLLAACSSPAAEGRRGVPVIVPGALVRHAAPTPEPAAPEPILVFAVDGEVDDQPGADRVSLTADGVLTAADAATRIEEPKNLATLAPGSELRVVDLGGGRHGVLVGLPTEADEDPPTRYRIYLYERGALRLVFDKVIGTYGRTPFLFEGDGIGYYEQDGWSACSGADYPQSVEQERVRFHLDEQSLEFVEIGRRKTGKLVRCDELAACPFVYVVGAEGPAFMGEVLRDVRGADAYTTQTLSLGEAAPGTLTVRVTEEKAEVTFLDAVSLDVNGVQVPPEECRRDPTLAYCKADGEPLVLREGDEIELTFQVPHPAGEVALRASGYYVPTPTRARPAAP